MFSHLALRAWDTSWNHHRDFHSSAKKGKHQIRQNVGLWKFPRLFTFSDWWLERKGISRIRRLQYPHIGKHWQYSRTSYFKPVLCACLFILFLKNLFLSPNKSYRVWPQLDYLELPNYLQGREISTISNFFYNVKDNKASW